MKLHFALLGGRWLLCSALLMIAGGCGPSGAAGLSIDKTTGMEALTTFLDTWKSGGTIDSLKSKSPAIEGSDFNWNDGATLESYEVVKEVRNDGANIDVLVELNITDKEGAASTVQATYTVGTEPVITVVRSDEEFAGE